MLTLDPVRPGLAAKGSFKTSNSEGRTIFISITYVKTSLANVWLANVSIQTTFLMWIFLSKRTRKNEHFFDKKAPFWQVFNDEEFPLNHKIPRLSILFCCQKRWYKQLKLDLEHLAPTFHFIELLKFYRGFKNEVFKFEKIAWDNSYNVI